RSLVERQRLDIDPYASNTADVSFHDGHVYSNKAPGLSFLTAVPYAVIHAVRGAPSNAIDLNIALYLCTVFVCGISGALIGVLLHNAALRHGTSPNAAFAIAMLIGLGTPLFAYSTMLFAHVPSALLLLVAWLLLDGTFERRPFLAGMAIGAATCINYLCAPIAIVLLLLLRSRRDALRFVAGGVPFAIALAAYQLAAFGSPFRTSIATMNPAFIERGALLGIFHLPRLDALWGITFSPYRGLFYLAPILLVALAGIVASKRWTIVAAFALLLLLNASFNGWHGGYAVGPRYLILVIPLLALGLTFLLPRARLIIVIAGAISLLFNIAVTAVDPQPPDILRDPIGRYALPSLIAGSVAENDEAVPPWIRGFYTGHTSTNRVAADEMLPFKSHAPGSTESEWASFNLGELIFGPGSLLSIVPWLMIVALAVVTHRQRADTLFASMKSIVLASIVLLGSTFAAQAQSAGEVQKLLTDEAARLEAWGSDPIFVAAVKAQNAKRVSAAQVKTLDEQWFAGTNETLVKQVTTGPCADQLRSLIAGSAAHGETFVMDNQGALVCATAKTSDYWQGDEAKWQRAFNEGKGSVFIDRPKFDDSSSQRLAQISVPVLDKGIAIGTITVGVATEKLKK
ncbi:MAG TPA: hypothetical protein VGQ76_20170, partial [Thermoanaerobaculia bacterium]|nr:hypothetical protein [Thermoanaerobaculia bacterium]